MKDKKIYKAKSGAQFDKRKVQVYGKFLNHLAKSGEGKITPREVVSKARSEDSPIYDCFEWDDGRAAEFYRVKQAQNLMNHIQIIVEYAGEEKAIPMFINLVIDKEGKSERKYIQTEIVARDEGLRKQAIEQALRELIAWQIRYKDIEELGAIFSVIEETQQRLSL